MKPHKNTPAYRGDRKRVGSIASAVGIVTNLFLAALKLLAGILSSSVAITADALNNLSDSGASIITLLGFRLSAKPRDKEHPFGHARMEYIASMVISFIILLVGTELLATSGKRLLGITPSGNINIGSLSIIILSVSIALKLFLGIYYLIVYRRIGAKVLHASAIDSFTDTASTAAALASGILVKYTGITLFDAIVGLAVSVLIILAGGKILMETKNTLLGEAPVEKTVSDIRKTVEKYPEVIGIHDLLVHNYGPGKSIASFHAEVNGDGDIYKLHDVIDTLEREIKDSHDILCTIHMDPIAYNDEKTNQYKEFLSGVLDELGMPYSVHDLRVVLGESHAKLIFDVVVPYEEKASDGELGEKIASAIKERRGDLSVSITIDRA